jgi:predicted ATPase
LNVIEQPDGNALRFLEVVREFALQTLRETGEFELLQKIHTDYFLALAEEAEPFLLVDGNVWLEKLKKIATICAPFRGTWKRSGDRRSIGCIVFVLDKSQPS